ncbi:MAG: phosphatase PAP2 family protein, partial [Actinomycetota bacterium]|nr:phosphatase PAP2 family protein [Actinomycetota bacterium]
TSQSTAVYGLIAVLLWQRYRGRTQRIATVMLGLAAILAVGMSRLYLGVHWFSDVLFGWVLGASWLAVALAAWTAIGDSSRR